jgi:hypothetical protein
VPLTLEGLLVQPVNSGSFNGSSGDASLPTGTQAGSTLLIVITSGSGLVNTVAGCTRDSPSSQGSNARIYCWRKTNTSAGETAWTITLGTSSLCRWSVFEVAAGLLADDTPLDVTNSNNQTAGTSSGTSASSGTSSPSSTYDGLVLCAWGTFNDVDATPITVSGHSKAVNLSVAMKTTQQLGEFSSSVDASQTLQLSPAKVAGGIVLVYSAQGAKRAADVALAVGFGWATTAGLTTGFAGNPLADSQAGTPGIVADTFLGGTHVLECSATSAAENLKWTATGALSQNNPTSPTVEVFRFDFYFPGSLPSADVEVAIFDIGATTADCVLRYRSASQKLGVQIGTGTEQLSAATVAADTAYGLDLLLDTSTGTHTAKWRLNQVDQTDATLAAASQAITGPQLGWTTAATATVRYGNLVVSKVKSHYPLGPFKVVTLKADPAGTLTVSGSTSNFNTFTANGTMAAWNATTARDAIDELPPTIGATADGLAQVAAASTEYVEIPLETYQAVSDEAIRGVRMLACGWAASGTTALIGFRSWDGTTEYTLFAAVDDPQFDNSTSTPAWVCQMVRADTGTRPVWTQTKLDALAFRVGFSGDATPDIGIHAIYAEVAVSLSLYATQQNDSIQSGGEFLITAQPGQTAGELLDVKQASHEAKGWTVTRTGSTMHAWKTYTEGSIGRKDRYFTIQE